MPHMSPQQIGEQEANRFLRNHDVPKEAFMKEGLELSNQYSDEYAQKGYLKGWKKTWPEDLQQEPKIAIELNTEQFTELEFLLQDRVHQLLQVGPGTYRDKKLEIAQSIIGLFPSRDDRPNEEIKKN